MQVWQVCYTASASVEALLRMVGPGLRIISKREERLSMYPVMALVTEGERFGDK